MSDPIVQAVAEALEVHQIEFIDWQVGWDCGCNERGYLPGMPTLSDALRHQAEAAVAAARPLIAAQALRDFADSTRFPNHWILFRRDDGSGVTVSDLLRETAADLIEREVTS